MKLFRRRQGAGSATFGEGTCGGGGGAIGPQVRPLLIALPGHKPNGIGKCMDPKYGNSGW